jgi:hypothetical protein
MTDHTGFIGIVGRRDLLALLAAAIFDVRMFYCFSAGTNLFLD